MHKQSIACDPEDVLSLDFEVVDGFRFVLWLDTKHGGGTGKRRSTLTGRNKITAIQRIIRMLGLKVLQDGHAQCGGHRGRRSRTEALESPASSAWALRIDRFGHTFRVRRFRLKT